jgi:leucine dehydrogenase
LARKKQTIMSNFLFDQIESLGHEQVVYCNDKATGLKAIIAIHDTTLGPALGGTRLWQYDSFDSATTDALRLSRGMTYKAAISGLNLGGGKAVIIGNPSMKNEMYWRRYGKFVDSLGGKYITAEDVNTSTSDMEFISQETKHVTGKPEYDGGSGDPSPFTAYGTFVGIKACAKTAWGNDSISGKKVMVQGAGHVGQYLIGHLVNAGALVMVTDINETRIKEVTSKYPTVQVIATADLWKTAFDIYAPCALGATVNTESIDAMNCQIIAGAANNQLAIEEEHGRMLIKKGIVYAPDFLINAGGLINVSAEIGNYNRDLVNAAVEKIYGRIHDCFALATEKDLTAQSAAMQMAQMRIDAMKELKSRR